MRTSVDHDHFRMLEVGQEAIVIIATTRCRSMTTTTITAITARGEDEVGD